MDLSKLTPAPWIHDPPGCVGHVYPEGGMRTIAVPGNRFNTQPVDLADAEFIALARNAFDGDPTALAWWESNRRCRTKES